MFEERLKMESRAFIRNVAVLIPKIEEVGQGGDEETRAGLQKEITQLFTGLMNPTLPSAYRLRDTAQAAGFSVNPQVLQRLAQFENLTA